jgi:CDP-diacylglycerol pyrophosphatase
MAGTGFTPPSDCDRDSVHGDRIKLWEVAQLTPDLANHGYVFLGGDIFFGFNKDTNKLLVPKVRITGIECPKVVGTTLPNYWQAAWDEAKKKFGNNVDIMLGIDSFDGRTQDQLHIHLTAFKSDRRKELNSLAPKTSKDLHKWNGNTLPLGTYAYRVAHVDSLDKNLFHQLDQYVATQANVNDRFAQSLGVVADTNGTGYYILATQGIPTQPNQPQHDPLCKAGSNWGTATVEELMDRRGK